MMGSAYLNLTFILIVKVSVNGKLGRAQSVDRICTRT